MVAALAAWSPALAQTDQPSAAQPPTSQPPSGTEAAPPPAWLPRDGADLVALDKISAKTLTLTLTIGQVARFGSLTIALRACDVRPSDQAPDATAWLDITDARPDAPQFHGWLIRSDPAVSGLQSPLCDVQLLGCH